MINIISAYSITQDVVGDCSFVSSLCVCAAYVRRRRACARHGRAPPHAPPAREQERRFKKQLVTRCVPAHAGRARARADGDTRAGGAAVLFSRRIGRVTQCTTPAASTW